MKTKSLLYCIPVFLGIFSFFSNSTLWAADYVGPNACTTCHGAIFDDYIQSGHPFKLNKVAGGVAPTYPFSEVPNPPDGVAWADVSYVIGGFGWKARFIDQNGFIITGDTVQYNLLTEGWVGYHADEAVGTKPYDCGKCHTTGWQTFEDNGGFRQDELPGMAGTFASPGVTCEACHGPGSDHVSGPSSSNIIKDTTKEMCGTCHTRDAEHRIAASGGFIKHHEQFDELINSPHRNLECGTCHNPHKSTIYGRGGLKDSPYCTDCHGSVTIEIPQMADFACESCHMPLASKSATTTGIEGVLGDIHSHTFRLNTEWDIAMFTDDGKFVNLDADGHAIVTSDFACQGCHNGVDASDQTIDWMVGNGRVVHTGGSYTWDVTLDLGDRWRESAWFGDLNDFHFPWIYHGEHGWMYDFSESQDSVLLWQEALGWVWTGQDNYPLLYRFNDGAWLLFEQDSSPRRFFNFTTQLWETIQ